MADNGRAHFEALAVSFPDQAGRFEGNGMARHVPVYFRPWLHPWQNIPGGVEAAKAAIMISPPGFAQGSSQEGSPLGMGLVAHLRAWARGLMSLMSSFGSSSGRILAGGGGGDGTAAHTVKGQ